MIYMMLIDFIVLFISACWGSFLNVIAYRLVYGVSLFLPRSFCPHCNSLIAAYDLIPIFSWIWLRGACRHCQQSISWLYPTIELLTMVVGWLIYATIPFFYWPAYALFASALIITIRTDIEAFLIFRFCTILLIPIALILSAYQLLPLTMEESLLGMLTGYSVLFLIRWISYVLKGIHGMGNGDPELLATVGAFMGSYACWWTLIIASGLGSIWGIILLLREEYPSKNTYYSQPIPFGPFIVLAVFIVLFGSQFIQNIII